MDIVIERVNLLKFNAYDHVSQEIFYSDDYESLPQFFATFDNVQYTINKITGVKDKINNNIYENDVLTNGHVDAHVKYDMKLGAYIVHYLHMDERNGWDYLYEAAKRFQLDGTIYSYSK